MGQTARSSSPGLQRRRNDHGKRSFRESTEGTPIDASQVSAIPIHLNYGSVSGEGGGCFYSGRLRDGFTLSVCTGWNSAGVGDTYVQYQRFADRVV